jgi:hypothetical protein
MSINIQIRKDAEVTVPESLLLAVIEAHPEEDINVIVYPGGKVTVTT